MSISLHNTVGSNYLKLRKLGAGAMGEVFEALAISDPTQRFAIKLMRNNHKGSFEHQHRFHQEAALLSQLYHPHIISLREFGITTQTKFTVAKQDISYNYIVMDYVHGVSLIEVLRSNGTHGLSLNFFFQLACQMASALDYTHSKNIIHRDIKPHNIMVEKTIGRSGGIHTKLLDFGVSTLREASNYIGGDSANHLDKVVGTPLYMSPELYSIKHQGMDHRCDLYSLGCVLYEVLTGRPPFRSKNLLELKQLHATAEPDNLLAIRKDVPRIVGRIITKLMAKDPADRYQSAFALYSDLLKVQRSTFTPVTNKNAQTTLVELGTNSQFCSLKRQLKLIGRSKELQQLIQFYSNVAAKTSRGHISLICGANGSGKSRLINELKEYFVVRKIKFISGLFIKYNSKNSLQCLAAGFNEYLLKVIRHQPLETKNIADRIKQIIGDRIYILTEIIPSIRLLIDIKDPSGQHFNFSDPNENITLLSKTFTDFTRCLISFDQPIVFIFDDIDFADKNSLHIIDNFFNLNNSEQIYIILSCHDGSQSPIHDHVKEFLDKIAKLRRRYQKISLRPLTLHQTSKLVCRLLKVKSQAILPIASYLFQEYGGDILHTIEKLRDLTLHGEVSHDLNNRCWSYDINLVRSARRPLTDIDLFLTRFSLFDQNTTHVIEAAAVYGMTFHKQALIITGIHSRKKLDSLLHYLVSEGVIAKIYDHHNEDSYGFVHSHYRDVILNQIDQDRKTGIHLATAIALSRHATMDQDKMVFIITHHFREGLRYPNPFVAITRSAAARAFYYAVKAGGVAKAKKTIKISIVYYQFAVNIMNNYLRPEQMKPGDWEKVNFEYITLLLREGIYEKATQILGHIFRSLLPIYRRGRSRNITRENLLECYLVLLLRISDYATISRLTRHYLKEMGVHLNQHSGLSFNKSLATDKQHYVSKFTFTSTSPTADLLAALTAPVRMARPRAIMLLNHLYIALPPHSTTAQLTHAVAMSQIRPGYSHHQDLIKLLHLRLRILHDHDYRGVLTQLTPLTTKIIGHMKQPRLTALHALHLACDPGLSHEFSYTKIRHFMVHQRQRFCYIIQDFHEMGHLYAANLTRLFLEEKLADIHDFLPVIRHHLSTRSPYFPYILLVLSHYFCYTHKKSKMHAIVLKIVTNRGFRSTHRSSMFFHLCDAFAMLHTDEFEPSLKAFIKAIKLLKQDPKMSHCPAYQVDFMLFSLIAYPAYFEALSGHIFPFSKPYTLLLRTAQSRFAATYPLTLVIAAMHGLGHKQTLSKKAKTKVVTQWEHASGEIAISGLKTAHLLVTALLNAEQFAIFSQNAAAIALLKLHKRTQSGRFIGMTLIIETMLTKLKIPYKQREQRTTIERKSSLFDEMISNLYFCWLSYVARPKFARLTFSEQFALSFNLFRDKFGAEDSYLLLAGADGTCQVESFVNSSEPLSPAILAIIKTRLDLSTAEIFSFIGSTPSPTTVLAEDHDEADHDAETAPISDGPAATTVTTHHTPNAAALPTKDTHNLTIQDHLSTITSCLVPLTVNQQPAAYLYIHKLSHQYRTNPKQACKEISLWAELLSQMMPSLDGKRPYDLVPFKPAGVRLAPCPWLKLTCHLPQNKLSPTAWVFGHELKRYQYLVVHLDIKAPSKQAHTTATIHRVSRLIWHHMQVILNHTQATHENSLLEDLKNDLMYLIRTLDTSSHEILSIAGFMTLISPQHTKAYLFNQATATTINPHRKAKSLSPVVLHRFQSQGSLLYHQYVTPTHPGSPLIVTTPLTPTASTPARHGWRNDKVWAKLPPERRDAYLASKLPKIYPKSLVITAETSHHAVNAHAQPALAS